MSNATNVLMETSLNPVNNKSFTYIFCCCRCELKISGKGVHMYKGVGVRFIYLFID